MINSDKEKVGEHMEQNQLYRLMVANNYELLKGYTNFDYSISDLQNVTQYPYKTVHNMLYNEFPEYVERRLDYKNKMYQDIEHFINLGIPIDIFKEDVPLISHIEQVKSLRRTIQRMVDGGKIEPETPPITMSRFKNLVQRVEIKDALIANMRATEPLTIKAIADNMDVSQSLVFKINRTLDEVDPNMNTQGRNLAYDKTEKLYDIYESYLQGMAKSDIASTYNVSNQDILIINKTFKLMDSY